LIQRTFDAETGFLHDVGINLSGCHILVTEQILNGAYVRARFQQVRGKTMTQMAEVAVPRELFRAILERIGRLRSPAAATG
jgi:hypothetical protein